MGTGKGVMMKNLRKKRKEKGLTQKELAEKVGITREYLNYLERGKCECSIKAARTLAKELDCDWTEIYDD